MRESETLTCSRCGKNWRWRFGDRVICSDCEKSWYPRVGETWIKAPNRRHVVEVRMDIHMVFFRWNDDPPHKIQKTGIFAWKLWKRGATLYVENERN
jgi:hypothetical protein